ncbi:hypothetical protein GT755_38340 [Herbidospora sp. NEAU-GS84]|uniref:Uncharacterized protein n=1 Tax=Herbidospora solisilvae TaxID=2696284 RepID=A0A7C9NK68_9ACTN|nr:hypothetical protein [Herbidospora solisilvae]NAS27515.1 hypothetical protein [Herbidospora solisilvae]
MATPERPSTVVNFDPQKERKARRRVLLKRRGGWRDSLANRVFETQAERENRRQFRRNISQIRMRRTLIARRMGSLAQIVEELMSDLRRIENRYPAFKERSLYEAQGLVKRAVSSTATCADEYALFARTRPTYIKDL